MESPVYMGFKFKIGDFVVLREEAISWKFDERTWGHTLRPKMISERCWQECPGGIQRRYAIFVSGSHRMFNEIELMPLEDAKIEFSRRKKGDAEEAAERVDKMIVRITERKECDGDSGSV